MKKILKTAAIATIGLTSVGLVSGCFNSKNNNTQKNEENKQEEIKPEILIKELMTYDGFKEYFYNIPEDNRELKKYNFEICMDTRNNKNGTLIRYNYSGSTNSIDPLNSNSKIIYSIEENGKLTNKGNMGYDFEYYYINNNADSYKILESNVKVIEDNYPMKKLTEVFKTSVTELNNLSTLISQNDQYKKELIVYKIISKDITIFKISHPTINYKVEVGFKNNALYSIDWDFGESIYECSFIYNENPSISIDKNIPEKDIQSQESITYAQFENYLYNIPENNRVLKKYDLNSITTHVITTHSNIEYAYNGSVDLSDSSNPKAKISYTIKENGKLTNKGDMAYDFKYFYINNNDDSYKILESNLKAIEDNSPMKKLTEAFKTSITELNNLSTLISQNEQDKKELIVYKIISKDITTFKISHPTINFKIEVGFKNNALYSIDWDFSEAIDELSSIYNENPSITINKNVPERNSF